MAVNSDNLFATSRRRRWQRPRQLETSPDSRHSDSYARNIFRRITSNNVASAHVLPLTLHYPEIINFYLEVHGSGDTGR